MQAAIDVVFQTLRGQLKSLEKNVLNGTARYWQEVLAAKQEDWELESRKHLAQMNQNRPDMHAACFGPTAPGVLGS